MAAQAAAPKRQAEASVSLHEAWCPVLETIQQDKDAAEKVQVALPAVELVLIIEGTNAGVERDAGLKRMLDEAMRSADCGAETVDARLRILSEGPCIDAMRQTKADHPLLVKAWQEFLIREKRRPGKEKDRKRPGPMTDSHKERLSSAKKRPKSALNADAPEVALPSGPLEGEEFVEVKEVDGMTPSNPTSLLRDLSDPFASGFASIQKPVPKKSRTKGKLLSCIPALVETPKKKGHDKKDVADSDEDSEDSLTALEEVSSPGDSADE